MIITSVTPLLCKERKWRTVLHRRTQWGNSAFKGLWKDLGKVQVHSFIRKIASSWQDFRQDKRGTDWLDLSWVVSSSRSRKVCRVRWWIVSVVEESRSGCTCLPWMSITLLRSHSRVSVHCESVGWFPESKPVYIRGGGVFVWGAMSLKYAWNVLHHATDR